MSRDTQASSLLNERAQKTSTFAVTEHTSGHRQLFSDEVRVAETVVVVMTAEGLGQSCKFRSG